MVHCWMNHIPQTWSPFHLVPQASHGSSKETQLNAKFRKVTSLHKKKRVTWKLLVEYTRRLLCTTDFECEMCINAHLILLNKIGRHNKYKWRSAQEPYLPYIEVLPLHVSATISWPLWHKTLTYTIAERWRNDTHKIRPSHWRWRRYAVFKYEQAINCTRNNTDELMKASLHYH